ncbi:hypothetical protein S13e_00068 [Klebsiella phage VLCpiS13e]|uniref:hypothetical protein n=1 Tax=Klebsiella phage VLCpiS13e TaxID=2874889 RepID=UPI00233E638A|nr:hypothetical protein PRB82_gp68 [Klebsiella phage VLCpiS13e]UVX31654.1 hypothetical protein S13e_00068 [Klebsiella phage VLCpiS13e]
MTKMTSREQFEQKIQHDFGEDYLAVNDDGDYINWVTYDLWEYWVSSRAEIEIELPEPCSPGDFCVDIPAQAHHEVIEAIESVGIKVKNETTTQ